MLPSFSSTPYPLPSLLSPNFSSCLYHSLYHSLFPLSMSSSLPLSLPFPSHFPCLHHPLYHFLFPPYFHVFIALCLPNFLCLIPFPSHSAPNSLSLSSCHPPYYLLSISHHPLFIFSRFLPISITINHNNNISQLKCVRQ